MSLNFKDKFLQTNADYKKFFTNKSQDKGLFDMRGLINFQLKILGIKNVFNLNEDTYKNDQLFFSHRRDKHNNLSETGRMINIISFL